MSQVERWRNHLDYCPKCKDALAMIWFNNPWYAWLCDWGYQCRIDLHAISRTGEFSDYR